MELSTTGLAPIRLFEPRGWQLEDCTARNDVRTRTPHLVSRQLAHWRHDRHSEWGDLLLVYGFSADNAQYPAVTFVDDRFGLRISEHAFEARNEHGVAIVGESTEVLYVPSREESITTVHAWELLALAFAWCGAYEQWVNDNYSHARAAGERDLRTEWWSLASRAREIIIHDATRIAGRGAACKEKTAL